MIDILKIIVHIVLWLKSHIEELCVLFSKKRPNYVGIKNCQNKNYLIRLKRFSWLDNIVISITINHEQLPFNLRRFNADDIQYNNVIEIQLPNDVYYYTINIGYTLKLFNRFTKIYEPKVMIESSIIGVDRVKTLQYKIIESK